MIGFASFFFFCLSFLVIAFLLLPWARFFSAISSTVAAFLKKGGLCHQIKRPLSGCRSSATLDSNSNCMGQEGEASLLRYWLIDPQK